MSIKRCTGNENVIHVKIIIVILLKKVKLCNFQANEWDQKKYNNILLTFTHTNNPKYYIFSFTYGS